MVFTDPPYNVDYEGRASQGKILNDKMSDKEFYGFLLAAFQNMVSCLLKGGGVYVCHADTGLTGITFRRAFMDAGIKMSACLVWRKNQAMLGRSDYQWQHEPILYGWKKGSAHSWYGGRKKKSIQELLGTGLFTMLKKNEFQFNFGGEMFVIRGKDVSVESLVSSVIFVEKPLKSKLHPTMKPIALIERFLNNSSRAGNIVLDPFGGSGSTVIACEKNARFARVMELDPKYTDVIVTRWQDFTGNEAILEGGDGKNFNV